MYSKGLHKEEKANYMTCDKQTKCPEDDLVQICFYLVCLLSLPNFEFHVLQAGDKKRGRLCYPSCRKTQDRNGSEIQRAGGGFATSGRKSE